MPAHRFLTGSFGRVRVVLWRPHVAEGERVNRFWIECRVNNDVPGAKQYGGPSPGEILTNSLITCCGDLFETIASILTSTPFTFVSILSFWDYTLQLHRDRLPY